MDSGLGQDGFLIICLGIDEGLEQMDGRNADNGGGEFDFQHRCIDMR